MGSRPPSSEEAVAIPAELSTVRAFLTERHTRLMPPLQEVGEALRERPWPQSDDEARAQARPLLKLLGEAGLPGHAVEEEFGGRGVDLRSCCLIRESLAAASPLADELFALQCLSSMPISLGGSRVLRRAWLPRVVSGEAMGAFAMTEPGAGSDVASMETRALGDGADYLLDGVKAFISNAGLADFYVVFASTDPQAGPRGLSCFLVESGREGVEFSRPQRLSAPHPLGVVRFHRCRVPAACRLGLEGEGFGIGLETLDRLRATVGAAACGMASRALEEALAYSLERRQFGKPLAEFQLIQEKLAVMATELAASRLLVYRAAWEKDGGADRVTLESAMAKAYACEAAQRIIDQSLQIHGGLGALADHPVEYLYRAVRALRIYEGTTEIQHLLIARQLLKARVQPASG